MRWFWILIIFMLLSAGCITDTASKTNTIIPPQPTVEPPAPAPTSALNPIPMAKQNITTIENSPTTAQTLSYSSFSISDKDLNKKKPLNTTITPTPTPTISPNQTIVPTQTPTPTPTPTNTITPTPTITISPTPTKTPIPTKTPTQIPTIIPTITPSGDYGAPSTLYGYALGGSYYGGGTQYPAYTSGVAGGNYDGATVRTKTELLKALSDASYGVGGAVIYIDPSANIDMGSTIHVKIPKNTTLASNRGVNGSPGGRIYTKTIGSGWTWRLFETGGTHTRITGLRIEGEAYPENYDPPNNDEGSIYRTGITIYHQYCEIDNNELIGFAYADIVSMNIPTNGRPWIHHNYIHGSQNRHEGYGIEICDGDILVEGNVFDRNRHDMTGGGGPDERYTFRYNYILPTEYIIVGMSHIDVHGIDDAERYSGYRYDIYGNTIAGGWSSSMHQRGKPVGEGTFIHHNKFYGDSSVGDSIEGGVPVWQSCKPDCGKMFVTNNYWDDKYYPTENGILWYQLR